MNVFWDFKLKKKKKRESFVGLESYGDKEIKLKILPTT